MADTPKAEKGIIGGENKIGPRDILAAATVLVVVSGYILTSNGKAEQTARDLTVFQARIDGTVAELRAEMRAGIASIRSDISLLPDQRARLTAVERRLSEGDARDIAQDQRLSIVEQRSIETRARLENVTAASSQSLPGAPGVRAR